MDLPDTLPTPDFFHPLAETLHIPVSQVAVRDVVTVRVLKMDDTRQQIGLSMRQRDFCAMRCYRVCFRQVTPV